MLNFLTVCTVLALVSVDLYCNRRPADSAVADYDYR